MLIGLDGSRVILLWWTLPAYMTLIGTAMLISGGVLLWETRKSWRLSHSADSVLLAAGLGVLFARIKHVALDWAYFSGTPNEILALAAGGLNAHGAVVGALLGGWLASRLFRSDFGVWLGAAAFALPLMALAAWWGCAAASCAYGSEVGNLADYPSWLVWEAQGDFLMVAPRYAVQPLGTIASVALLGLVVLSAVFGLRGRRRAGLSLAGTMMISFFLAFLRGDLPAASGILQITQMLDLALIVVGVLLAAWPRRMSVPAP